jgi:hypothetical protein
MSRSETFLHLCEGFKLGSLGATVGGKADLTRSVELSTKESPQGSVFISGFHKEDMRKSKHKSDTLILYTWNQNVDPSWNKVLKIDSKDYDFLPTLHVGVFLQKPNKNGWSKVALLIDYKNSKDKTVALFFRPTWTQFAHPDSILEWGKIHEPKMENKGLKALKFPGDWKEVEE